MTRFKSQIFLLCMLFLAVFAEENQEENVEIIKEEPNETLANSTETEKGPRTSSKKITCLAWKGLNVTVSRAFSILDHFLGVFRSYLTFLSFVDYFRSYCVNFCH